jgi:hypothetical protein
MNINKMESTSTQKKILIITFILIAINQISSTSKIVNADIDLIWEQKYGKGFAFCVQPTHDDGYILVGRRAEQILLIKTDSHGNETWTREIGGRYWQSGYSVQQTKDNGYIISGRTYQPKMNNNSTKHDILIYLTKTDSSGYLMWNKTYGGKDNDYGRTVRQTNDGGFILVGFTETDNQEPPYVSIIKTSFDGTIEWRIQSTNFSIPVSEAWDVQQTHDGGYIITGGTQLYLLKIGENGLLEWIQKYDGYMGKSVRQTKDGGFVVLGLQTMKKNESNGGALLVKTDGTGNLEWSKTYGSLNSDVGRFVELTSNGGHLILYSRQDTTTNIVRTDPNGEVIEQTEIDGIGYYALTNMHDEITVTGSINSGATIFMSRYKLNESSQKTVGQFEENSMVTSDEEKISSSDKDENSKDLVENNNYKIIRNLIPIIFTVSVIYIFSKLK